MTKQFFTLSEFTAYLAHATGEAFSVGDMVRLIRSGKLYVYFEYLGEITNLSVTEYEKKYSIGVLDFVGVVQSLMPPVSGDELNHPLLSVMVVDVWGQRMSYKDGKLVRGGNLPTERPDGGLILPNCTVLGYIEDASIQMDRWLIHSDDGPAFIKAASPALTTGNSAESASVLLPPCNEPLLHRYGSHIPSHCKHPCPQTAASRFHQRSRGPGSSQKQTG